MVKKSIAQPRPNLEIEPKGIGPINEPNKNDVLSGRGGRINAHVGNMRFRDYCHQCKKDYLAPTTKKLEKAHIAAGIVSDIRHMDPPGRFLKQESSDGMWWDIGDFKAIKKVGQALREDAPEIRPDLGDGSSEEETIPPPAHQTLTSHFTPGSTPSAIPTCFNTASLQSPPASLLAVANPNPTQQCTDPHLYSGRGIHSLVQDTIAESASVYHAYARQVAEVSSVPAPLDPHQQLRQEHLQWQSQNAQYVQQPRQNANMYDMPRQLYHAVQNNTIEVDPDFQAVSAAADSSTSATTTREAFGRGFVPTSSNATMSTLSFNGSLFDSAKLKSSEGSGSYTASQAVAASTTASQGIASAQIQPDFNPHLSDPVENASEQHSLPQITNYRQIFQQSKRSSRFNEISDTSILSFDQSLRGLSRSNSFPELTHSLRHILQTECSTKSISEATMEALVDDKNMMEDSWSQLGNIHPRDLTNFGTGNLKESASSGTSGETHDVSAGLNVRHTKQRRPSMTKFRTTSNGSIRTSNGSIIGMSMGSQRSLRSSESSSWTRSRRLLLSQDDESMRSFMSELSTDMMALDLA